MSRPRLTMETRGTTSLPTTTLVTKGATAALRLVLSRPPGGQNDQQRTPAARTRPGERRARPARAVRAARAAPRRARPRGRAWDARAHDGRACPSRAPGSAGRPSGRHAGRLAARARIPASPAHRMQEPAARGRARGARAGQAGVQAHGDERRRARAQAVPGHYQAPATAVQLALHDGRYQVPAPLLAAAPGALPARARHGLRCGRCQKGERQSARWSSSAGRPRGERALTSRPRPVRGRVQRAARAPRARMHP